MITRNEFLLALPDADRSLLMQAARRIHLPQRFTFYQSGESPDAVYFIETGMASELIRMEDGRTMDVSPVGRRGLVGVPALLEAESSFHHCVMQVPGDALRVPVRAARKLLDESGEFRRIAGRFLHARFAQATQSAACNLLHKMEQRLARWLLITCNHTGSEEFQISQEYLSEMLGVNRSTVTTTLGSLERAGIIDLDRTVIKLKNNNALAAISCECYRIIVSAFDQIPLRSAQ